MINLINIIFLFLLLDINGAETGKFCEVEARVILTDSVLSKDDNLKIRLEVHNISKKPIYYYPEFIDIRLISNGVRSISGCLINEQGEKLFLNVRKKKVKVKIQKGKKYISNEFVINLSHICWENNLRNLDNFEVLFSYYDFSSKKIVYSLPESVRIDN